MDYAGGRLCGGGACLPGVSPVQQRRGADSGGAFAVDDSPHGEFRHERQVHHRAQHFFYHAANGRRGDVMRPSRPWGLLWRRSGSVRMWLKIGSRSDFRGSAVCSSAFASSIVWMM